MQTEVSMINYNGGRSSLDAITTINDGIITLDIPEFGMILTGNDVDRDTNEKVILKSDDHRMELDWKSSFKLVGKWKSKQGNWSTTAITINDLKEKSQESWWDRDDFADSVETSLVTLYEGKLNYADDNPLQNWERITKSQFNRLKKIGIYFSPYCGKSETYIEKMKNIRPGNHDTFNRFGSHANNLITRVESPYDVMEPFTQMSLARISEQDDEYSKNHGLTIGTVLPRFNENSFVSGHLILSFLVRMKTTKFDRSNLVPVHGSKRYNLPKDSWYELYELVCKENGYVIGIRRFIGIEFKKKTFTTIIPYSLYKQLKLIENGAYMTNKNLMNDIESGRIAMGLNAFNACGYSAHIMNDDYNARQPLWKVEAEEDGVRSSFGVNHEQIKSLFYYADKGVTKSGRRAALMGWIRSHQRRIKDGIDVTIVKKHLRGQNQFKIHNTHFKIIEPMKPVR